MNLFQSITKFFALYRDRSLLAFLLMGIASGIPLPLTAASVLSIMLREKGVDLATIGTFALSSLPYSLKYLWAPLLDAYGFAPFIKFMGKRNSWLPITQILLCLAITSLGSVEGDDLSLIRVAALAVAALSATQDILIDSLRIRSLPQEKQGAGAAAAVLGYRIGMIIASAGGLYMAEYGCWTIAYCALGAVILLSMPLVIVMAIKDHISEKKEESEEGIDNKAEIQERKIAPKQMRVSIGIVDIFFDPWRSFIAIHPRWYLIMLSLIFYKLSDAYLGAMTSPFLIEIGFNKAELASIIKLYGTIATFTGMFFGGYLIANMSIAKCFYLGVIIQSVSNLAFIFQYYSGHDIYVLILVNSIENFCGGISSSILVAFISSLCQRQFTASHYAMFAALASVGRTLISSSSGYAVEQMGWCYFFIFSSVLSLPAIVCLYCSEKKYKAE